MAAPGLLLLFVFAYSPVVGIIAFNDYRFDNGALNRAWVGLDNFRLLSGTDSARRITRDTLQMHLLFIRQAGAWKS